MRRQRKLSMYLAAARVICVALLVVAAANALSQEGAAPCPDCRLPPTLTAGQTATLMPDGQWLLLGGKDVRGPIASASVVNSETGAVTSLPAGLTFARAWQTATVVPDGSVVILGGLGKNNRPVSTPERYDPGSRTFSKIPRAAAMPRYRHTATLLSDGQILIVGGISSRGATLGDGRLWDPRTNRVTLVAGGLATARSGHNATLTSDGNVLIQGGFDARGNRVTSSELYDAKLQSFVPAPAEEESGSARPAAGSSAPELAGSIPADGATGVPVNTIISLRFSEPMQVQTVNAETVTLAGPDGDVAARVVPAEAGMLAFVNPDSRLAPNTRYTVAVDGVMARDGAQMARASVSFTTGSGGVSVGSGGGGSRSSSASSDSPGVWIPTPDWRTHLPPSPWQSLPALLAPGGVTALSGQVLTIDGSPLAGVTLQVGSHTALSDNSGRFLILGLKPGSDVLLIDGTSANSNGTSFGIFKVGVAIAPNVTTVLPFTIWMPVLDTVHAITIPSPTTQEIVFTNPLMPGLDLHIPAGTVIKDIKGKVVTTLSMTPIPLDRPPFPLPADVDVPIYFTIQPGGAELWTTSGQAAWARLIYPNSENWTPGTRIIFWGYEPGLSGWWVYGWGTVSTDGSQIVPDPGVGFADFNGDMIGNAGGPPGTGNSQCDSGCDPVDASTGILRHSETDLHLSDVIPLDLRRTYLSQDNYSRPFGVGATDNYEIFMTADNNPLYTRIDLILSDGERVHYSNTNPNTSDYVHALFVPTLSPTALYYGSTITWNGAGWNLRLKNGTIYGFPDSFGTTSPAKAALLGITDRYGNKVTVSRDASGNVTQITSPDGRWIQFQHDSSNRITQATDSIGRKVTYTYDSYIATGRPDCSSTGLLCAVTDANGGVTSYSYDSGNRMLTITDPRGYTTTNSYDPGSGRLIKQTLADGASSYQFAYTVNGSGQVTQASITDPNGVVEVKSFDSNGFLASEVYASGVSGVQQSFSLTRDPSTELTTAVTDPLGRQFSYGYDSNGNLTSAACHNCLSQAVSLSATYEPTFSQITGITDPLGHTWSIARDSRGNPTAITDPLNHQVALGWDFTGRLTSITDPANDTARFAYSAGDLASITDPLGNTTAIFMDNAGRLAGVTDPLGNTSQFAYDNLGHPAQISDANRGTTSFSYDGDGDLLSLTDANGNKTSYAYDSRDRLVTRTDALGKSDSYAYDADSNLTSHTDRDGNVINYSYDALSRVTQASFNVPGKGGKLTLQSTIGYSWDGGNRVTQAADSIAGTISRGYDGLNRLTSEASPQGTVSYAYDNASRRTAMTVGGQGAVNYAWDNANRLTGISQGSSAVGLSYDNANRRTQLTLPNNVTVAYTYDNDSRVSGISYNAGSTNLGNLTYSYDPAGRRTAVGGSLAAVTLPASVAGGTSTSYNADNEQTKFNRTSQGYDANGNLLSDGTNSYAWDARGHLTGISGGATASFVYDAFGRRMKKTVGGTVTQFLYDGLNPVQELNGSGGVAANLLTGLKLDEVFTRTDSSGTMAFLADALGSTVGLVNSAGAIGTSYTYQPFGGATVSGTNGNPYQFTGRENDGTGLYFYRARYYSPTFQRFIAQDPIGFGGGDANLYGYAFYDPTNIGDPSGLGDILPGPTGPRPRPPWMLPPKNPPDAPIDIRPRLPRSAPNCTAPPPWIDTLPLDPIFPWVIPMQPFCDQFPGLCGPPMT